MLHFPASCKAADLCVQLQENIVALIEKIAATYSEFEAQRDALVHQLDTLAQDSQEQQSLPLEPIDALEEGPDEVFSCGSRSARQDSMGHMRTLSSPTLGLACTFQCGLVAAMQGDSYKACTSGPVVGGMQGAAVDRGYAGSHAGRSHSRTRGAQPFTGMPHGSTSYRCLYLAPHLHRQASSAVHPALHARAAYAAFDSQDATAHRQAESEELEAAIRSEEEELRALRAQVRKLAKDSPM